MDNQQLEAMLEKQLEEPRPISPVLQHRITGSLTSSLPR
jgi:hypothetical protein